MNIILRFMKLLRVAFLMSALLGVVGAKEVTQPEKPPLNPEMVNAEVFKKRYQRVNMAETLHYTEFVGVVDGVAILHVGDMHLLTKGWREKWIGVKLEDLDAQLRKELEEAAALIRAKQEAESKN